MFCVSAIFASFLEFRARTRPQLACSCESIRFFSAQVSSFTVSSALSQLVNRAEISHLNPRGNWSRCGMPLWKWTCELVTDLFQELFHFLGWSRILNRLQWGLQFYFGCLMLRFSSGYVKTKIGGTDKYQIFLYMIPHPHPILRGFPRKICI